MNYERSVLRAKIDNTLIKLYNIHSSLKDLVIEAENLDTEMTKLLNELNLLDYLDSDDLK